MGWWDDGMMGGKRVRIRSEVSVCILSLERKKERKRTEKYIWKFVLSLKLGIFFYDWWTGVFIFAWFLWTKIENDMFWKIRRTFLFNIRAELPYPRHHTFNAVHQHRPQLGH